MPVKKTSISLDPSVVESMELREPQLSTAITKSLARYLYAMGDARHRLGPQFSDKECGLMLDACNGTLFYPFSINLLSAGIEDAIEMDGLAPKWDVDAEGLLKKLNGLDYFERLVIVDAIEVWWNRTSEDPQPKFGDLFTGHPDNKRAHEFQVS